MADENEGFSSRYVELMRTVSDLAEGLEPDELLMAGLNLGAGLVATAADRSPGMLQDQAEQPAGPSPLYDAVGALLTLVEATEIPIALRGWLVRKPPTGARGEAGDDTAPGSSAD